MLFHPRLTHLGSIKKHSVWKMTFIYCNLCRNWINKMRLTASSSAKRKSGPIEKGSLPTVPIQEVLAQCLPTFFDACAHSGTFDCSPIELLLLPYGTFVPPLWNFRSSPMELSFLPYGTFIPPLWNFHSFPMELSFLPYGTFIPPLWNFHSSPVELLFLPYGTFIPLLFRFVG